MIPVLIKNKGDYSAFWPGSLVACRQNNPTLASFSITAIIQARVVIYCKAVINPAQPITAEPPLPVPVSLPRDSVVFSLSRLLRLAENTFKGLLLI